MVIDALITAGFFVNVMTVSVGLTILKLQHLVVLKKKLNKLRKILVILLSGISTTIILY